MITYNQAILSAASDQIQQNDDTPFQWYILILRVKIEVCFQPTIESHRPSICPQ